MAAGGDDQGEVLAFGQGSELVGVEPEVEGAYAPKGFASVDVDEAFARARWGRRHEAGAVGGGGDTAEERGDENQGRPSGPPGASESRSCAIPGWAHWFPPLFSTLRVWAADFPGESSEAFETCEESVSGSLCYADAFKRGVAAWA